MARDTLGKNGDCSVFSSNIAAIGGFSGGPNQANGIQLFVRTGVTSPKGLDSKGLEAIMLQKGEALSTYKLSLRKTNSGFEGKVVDLITHFDSGWKAVFAPDILNVQDKMMYVGFYTARLAEIEVSNISLKTTRSTDDEPVRVKEEHKKNFTIKNNTRLKTANKYETIHLIANADCTLNFVLFHETEKKEQFGPFKLKENLSFAYELNLNLGKNKLLFTFLPNDLTNANSFNEYLIQHDIFYHYYEDIIYVHPDGLASNSGSKQAPLDIYTAIEFLKPGQEILLAGGEYKLTQTLNFTEGNDGKSDNLKFISAEDPANRPILNFMQKWAGLRLAANYWHLKNINVTGSKDNTPGIIIGGNHNILENIKTYRNGDTGLLISRTNDSKNIIDWPSNNLILKCESFDNQDPSNNNADGFAAKLAVGKGNIFKGCIAYNNIDDGFDLYTKLGLGPIGFVTIEDCITYNNGWMTDNKEITGDGNGFKLGGEGICVPHHIKNSIAFNNLTNGLTSNSNPGIIAENIISFDNGRSNIVLSTYKNADENFTIQHIYSFRNKTKFVNLFEKLKMKDKYPIKKKNETTYLYNGCISKNSLGQRLIFKNNKNIRFLQTKEDININIINDLLSSIIKLNNKS